MRIGQINNGNYADFVKLFSGMNRKNNGINNTLFTNSSSAGAQLLKNNGYEKVNIYGMEGMDITGRSDFKKIVSVSDEAKEKISDCIKKDFINNFGMTGKNSKRHDIVRNYISTLPAKDRASATWTLNQLMISEGQKLADKVKEQNPTWKPGQPFDTSILEKNTSVSIDIKV